MASDEPDGGRRPLITWTQLAGAGLATAAATVAASFLGVYGTVTGAALMSVISTGGTVLIQRGLSRTHERVRDAVTTQLHVQPAEPSFGDAHRADVRSADADADADADAERPPRRWRPPRWAVWAIAAVAVFAVVMGVVTLVELAIREPLSSAVRGGGGTGTTFGGHATGTPTPGGPTTPGRTTTSAPPTPSRSDGERSTPPRSPARPTPSPSTGAPTPSGPATGSAGPRRTAG